MLSSSIRYLVLTMSICCLKPAAGQEYPYTIDKETMEYFFHAGKTKYDNYTPVTSLEILCTRDILIESEEGVARFQNFTLPEKIDPVYHDILGEVRNSGFYLDQFEVKEVSIRVIRNGKSRNVDVAEPTITTVPVFNERSLAIGKALNYVYPIPKLKIGDQIKIKYHIVVPYEPNIHELGSFRIFLHSVVPKKNVQIRLKKSESAQAIFNYRNGSEPHSSFTSDVVLDKWNFDYLPPLLSEVQSRPGSDAPFIEVTTSMNNILGLCTPRFDRMDANREAIRIGSTYKNYKLLNAYLDTFQFDVDMDSSIMIRDVINTTSNYAYDKDSIYFSGEKLFDPSFGEDLLSEKIRESNKYETYAAILDALGGKYLILTPIDKRVGELTDQYARPAYTGENLFGVIIPSGLAMFVPKSTQCSYYLDELPFYFEDSKMLLFDLHKPIYNMKELALTFDTRFQGWHVERPMVESTSSTEQENTRKCMTTAQISLSEQRVELKGRLSLGGQFSTLCRSMYVCDEATPFVNEQYNQRIWENRTSLNALDHSVVSQSSDFPFPIRFDFSFTEPVLNNEENEEYTFDLGGLINHVDYALDTTSERQLPFYPDFLQTDNFSFMVQFDEPVEMVELPESIVMGSALGSYQFSVKFENNTLRVFSQLMIDNPKIETEEFPSAVKVYQAIQKVENTTIRFRKIN